MDRIFTVPSVYSTRIQHRKRGDGYCTEVGRIRGRLIAVPGAGVSEIALSLGLGRRHSPGDDYGDG